MTGLALAPIRFAQPWWLLAMLLAALPAVLALHSRRRGWQAVMRSSVLQTLAVALAAAALAGPQLPGRRAEKPYLLLEDVSASTRGQSQDAMAWPQELPSLEYRFAQGLWPGDIQAPPSADARASNVSPALQLAAARTQELAGAVIRTDGHFTDAGWTVAAEALGKTALPLAIVPLDGPPIDGRIADFSARRRPDGKVDLAATVASNGRQHRTLVIRRPTGQVLLERRFLLLAGDSASIRTTDDAPADRLAQYEAALIEPDEMPENDACSAAALPLAKRVALVAGEPFDARGLAGSLATAIETITPSKAPTQVDDWMDYSAVVLADSRGTLLSPAQRQALAQYVRGGGGLLTIGSGPAQSPADRDDPLNQVLALTADPYERKPLRLVVVLDASGSMSEPARAAGAERRIKFDVAAQAVLALRSHLTQSDSLAVIVFADEGRLIYDSGDSIADFAALRDALLAVRPAGATKVNPALTKALTMPPLPPRQTLVLLLSDLLTEQFDASATAQAFRSSGSALAVVAVSGVARPPGALPLESLAAMLDAPLIRRQDLEGLAEVFASFIRDSRGEPVRRGNFKASAPAGAFGLAGLPPIAAYVLSAPRDEAEVLATVGADAVLARRLAGLGRSATLAIPWNDNPSWHDSQGKELLARAVRWVMRPGDDSRFWTELARQNGSVRITVSARDDSGPMNLLELKALIQPADAAEARQTDLLQTAPGQYSGILPAADDMLAVEVRDSQGRTVWRGTLGRTYPPEFRAIGADWQNLRKLARLTGGQIVRQDDLAGLARQFSVGAYRPAWVHLLAAALALMLAEWALSHTWRR